MPSYHIMPQNEQISHVGDKTNVTCPRLVPRDKGSLTTSSYQLMMEPGEIGFSQVRET